jgi:hypothetical protein
VVAVASRCGRGGDVTRLASATGTQTRDLFSTLLAPNGSSSGRQWACGSPGNLTSNLRTPRSLCKPFRALQLPPASLNGWLVKLSTVGLGFCLTAD